MLMLWFHLVLLKWMQSPSRGAHPPASQVHLLPPQVLAAVQGACSSGPGTKSYRKDLESEQFGATRGDRNNSALGARLPSGLCHQLAVERWASHLPFLSHQ